MLCLIWPAQSNSSQHSEILVMAPQRVRSDGAYSFHCALYMVFRNKNKPEQQNSDLEKPSVPLLGINIEYQCIKLLVRLGFGPRLMD